MFRSVQVVTVVIIQFIKDNTLMVLKWGKLRQINLVYFHRTLLISSTYALGHCEMLVDSLHLTYAELPKNSM